MNARLGMVLMAPFLWFVLLQVLHIESSAQDRLLSGCLLLACSALAIKIMESGINDTSHNRQAGQR